MVRAIKYLGIYRHEALPELPARRDKPRTRRVDGELSKGVPMTTKSSVHLPMRGTSCML